MEFLSSLFDKCSDILFRIKDDTFSKYLKQRYISNIDYWSVLHANNIIVTSFNSWKYNYELNPDKWHFVKDEYFYCPKDNIYFPYTIVREKYTDVKKVIKFLTKKDYKKFFRYYNKFIKVHK